MILIIHTQLTPEHTTTTPTSLGSSSNTFLNCPLSESTRIPKRHLKCNVLIILTLNPAQTRSLLLMISRVNCKDNYYMASTVYGTGCSPPEACSLTQKDRTDSSITYLCAVRCHDTKSTNSKVGEVSKVGACWAIILQKST